MDNEAVLLRSSFFFFFLDEDVGVCGYDTSLLLLEVSDFEVMGEDSREEVVEDENSDNGTVSASSPLSNGFSASLSLSSTKSR